MALEGMYLMKKGLKIHPFVEKSLMLREICIKSLEGSIAKELINLHDVN